MAEGGGGFEQVGKEWVMERARNGRGGGKGARARVFFLEVVFFCIHLYVYVNTYSFPTMNIRIYE